MTKTSVILLIVIMSFLPISGQAQTYLEFEKSVVKEIFPALLDSIHTDRRLFDILPVPPPPEDQANNAIKTKWSDSDIIAAVEKRKVELELDSTTLVIAIVDSTYNLNARAIKEFLEFYGVSSIKGIPTFHEEPYKINITGLPSGDKIKIIYRSDLPATDVWKEKYDFHLSGIIGISRIQFDETKNYGVLITSFGCGRLCGFSGLVFIRKAEGKWVIDKVKVTAVS